MKRTAHKKKQHNIDIMKPIIAMDLGSENDPCFGKHYSIKAEECRRCGDADVCSIICQSQLHKEIQEQSTKAQYLDVEESQLIDAQNKKLEGLIRVRGKKKPGTWISFEKLVPTVRDKFNLTEKDDLQTLNRLIKAAKNVPEVIINKSLTKFQWK